MKHSTFCVVFDETEVFNITSKIVNKKVVHAEYSPTELRLTLEDGTIVTVTASEYDNLVYTEVDIPVARRLSGSTE
jgi:Glu-tRNA(Gln) amidotransferase subunit E-like FAD-binding protein